MNPEFKAFLQSAYFQFGVVGSIATAFIGSFFNSMGRFDGAAGEMLNSSGLLWGPFRTFLFDEGGWITSLLGGIAAALATSAISKMKAPSQ